MKSDKTIIELIKEYAQSENIEYKAAYGKLYNLGLIEVVLLDNKQYLQQSSYIEYETVDLTKEGRLIIGEYGNFIKYFIEKNEREAHQLKREERDEATKNLQLQKLEAEMAVLKQMQNEQRFFWQSGIDRDKRQRWQYWLTLFLAGGGFLLGVINFVKDVLLRK